jgi:hypothetical protein
LIQKEIKRPIPKINVNIDRSLVFMGIISLGILLCILFKPDLFLGYDTGRIQELIFIPLSIFLIIGACFLFNLVVYEKNADFLQMKSHKKIVLLINYLKLNQNKIISIILLFILIPQLLFATFISFQIDGGPYSIILNSPKYSKNIDQLGFSYTYDQDAMAIKWLKDYSYRNVSIYSDDYGTQKITSTIGQKSTLYQKSLTTFEEEDIVKGYIFLTVINEYYASSFTFNGEDTKISSLNHIIDQKNKIFSNGAVFYK